MFPSLIGHRMSTHFARHLMGLICGLCIAIGAPAANAVTDDEAEESAAIDDLFDDCRYHLVVPPEGSAELPVHHQIFPRDNIFQPLVASNLEPRFFGNFGWADYTQPLNGGPGFDAFISTLVGLAGTAGIWTRRRGETCNGVQLNFFGGAFSKFALNPLYLINVDYQGGLSATLRQGSFSGRLRLYHQSGHIGDDFLLENPEFPAYNLSFEAIDTILSFDIGWARFYGGAGWMIRRDPQRLKRFSLEMGADLIGSTWRVASPIPATYWSPVAGTHITTHQARQWGTTWTTKTGAEFVGHRHRRRLRLMATFLYGYTPYGLFFDNHRLRLAGLEIQFVY